MTYTTYIRQWQKVCCLLLAGIYGSFSGLSGQQISLLFAGDAMQHQTQINNAYKDGRYDYSSCFLHVKEEIQNADLAVINFETTLGGAPYKGYPMFSAPDEFAVALKEAGFDVFLTANNHCLDRYSKGLERTIEVLDTLNIHHLGTYRNSLEKVRTYPFVVNCKGIRIAMLNYTYGTNNIKVQPPNVVNYIDTMQMKKDIIDAKGFLKADIVIANLHWGEEYRLNQNRNQERLAAFLMKQGVDIIIGAHPHVVQPSIVYKDDEEKITHVIAYSLGNFISNMPDISTNGGQMIKIILEKNEEITEIKSCTYQLIYVDKPKIENKTQFILLPVQKAENNPSLLSTSGHQRMPKFAKEARDLFRKYNIGVEEDTPQKKEEKRNSSFYENSFLKFPRFTDTDFLLKINKQ